jgi:hypothetical protein
MTHVTKDREHFAAETLWEGMEGKYTEHDHLSPSRGSSVRFDDRESESKSMGCLIHVRSSSSRLRRVSACYLRNEWSVTRALRFGSCGDHTPAEQYWPDGI